MRSLAGMLHKCGLLDEQTLLREVLGDIRRLLPFELLGFDTDNDSVFVNEMFVL